MINPKQANHIAPFTQKPPVHAGGLLQIKYS